MFESANRLGLCKTRQKSITICHAVQASHCPCEGSPGDSAAARPCTRPPHMSWRRVALRAVSRRAASHSQAARANGSSAVNSSFQDIPCQLTSGITGWRPHPIRDKTTKKGKQK